MRQEGMLLTCDRCNVQIMLTEKREHVTDGGFTKWNTYDDEPDGWFKDINYYRNTDLCPDCSKEYKEVINDFYVFNKGE